MDTAPAPTQPLFTPEFVILSVISFLAFCNLSLFYGFNDFLVARHVPPMWRGILLGLEPGTAFLVRPFLSPLLTVRNSLRVMLLGLLIIMAALLGYLPATGLWAMVAVRVAHGLGFVLLISASVTLLVEHIPAERSGQGFGVFAVASLLPYAIIPPVAEFMLPSAGSEPLIYARFTILLLPAMFLLIPLGRSARRLAATLPPHHGRRPTLAEIRLDLGAPGVPRLLAANLLLFTATTVVFFYMKDHLRDLGTGNPGLFFTISTAMTILVRVACGRWLDRINRAAMLTFFLALLAATLWLFGLPRSDGGMLPLAALYGACVGFIMPQLNASMFVISPPHLRGLNTNLMLFTMDGGYFFGPLLAGALQSRGMTLPSLFALCSAGPLLGGLLTLSLVRLMGAVPQTRRG
jgi:MFS family permease